MTAHQLAALLLAGPDDEVFMSPNVQPVDAVEQCPGDPEWVGPYIVLHDGSHRKTPAVPMFCYKHSSYYCGCILEAAS